MTATEWPLLCRSVASCSARSNCGSSPCSPPSGGCAWLRSRRCAANLTGLARDCRGDGRSGRRNRRLDRTKEHPPAGITRLPARSTRSYKHAPSAGVTMNVPHTEMLIGPAAMPRAASTPFSFSIAPGLMCKCYRALSRTAECWTWHPSVRGVHARGTTLWRRPSLRSGASRRRPAARGLRMSRPPGGCARSGCCALLGRFRRGGILQIERPPRTSRAARIMDRPHHQPTERDQFEQIEDTAHRRPVRTAAPRAAAENPAGEGIAPAIRVRQARLRSAVSTVTARATTTRVAASATRTVK